MKQKTTIFLFLFLLTGLKTFSQFTLDAELRNRFELRNGYRLLIEEGSTPAFLIWQRSRISLNYETENLKLKFTPQDVRLWGDESQQSSTGVFGDVASMEIFEAYAEFKLINNGWISIGRQPLKYDNQRLMAARNWNNNGLTYDAVLIKLQTGKWNIHLGSTWNNLKEISAENPYPSNRIKNLNFLWCNKKISDQLSLSILNMASGVTEADTSCSLYYKITSGFYSELQHDDLNVWGESYYQYGKNNSGAKARAFMLALDANYKLDKLTPGLGVTYLSGNNKTGNDRSTDKLFDILYGARHRFYGYMDYFRSFSLHTNQGGLVDICAYLIYSISKPVSIQNTGHYFQLAQTNESTPPNKNLGYENDLALKYKFTDWGVLETGYLFYLPTSSLKEIQNVESTKFQQFLFVQLTLTPSLFKQTAN